jgi:hypothetical protein
MQRQVRGSPEDELLLLLVRGRFTPEVQDDIGALLGQELSWPHILRQARAHDLFPILYRNLQTIDFPGVPTAVRAELADACRLNALRNALLVRELIQVLRLLGEAGVPVIPLKGVALAESLYGDLTLRVCVDIDILVPRPLVAPALHLLLARGYTARFTEQFFADVLLASTIEYVLVREDRWFRYLLELHWGILWGKRWDGDATEDLWAQARPHVCFGVPAYTVSPEWEFLFLAAHAARHHWQGLKWLLDIHEVCCQREINWETVRDKAERLGWEEVVRLTLNACHALFETPLPAPFSVRALPPWLQLFPDDPPPRSWQDAFFPLYLLKRPSDRLSYALNALFVPTLAERQSLRLPAPLLPLYYPLRPLRLGCKWGWRLVLAGLQRLRGYMRRRCGW